MSTLNTVSRDGASSVLGPTEKHENMDQNLCEGFSPVKPWGGMSGQSGHPSV